ncbi:hypothetical protein M408DRAFT_26952 [Serendipita vermifera MAFF 305830]|uniref:Ketoreductase domain-containing protein n=1 Tax=Serendipita vermifera MAFF 305830 TaxID=933852 RepID=A0A0C3AWX2_SERVB|nr:hypothetical protein M408DRAFT_26952 [Serendipita vermifera MAFF 305830]
MSLHGKVAIITGSSRGIGAATAIALANEGAHIVINHSASSSKDKAENVARNVRGTGSQALVVQADISSLEEINLLVKKTVEHFGKIDILVNNTGIIDFQAVGSITLESYQRIFDINLRAPIFLSQAAVAHMGDGGRIINVSGTAAREGNPTLTVYSASKAALESITRVMGVELRDRGIRVTAVNPGTVFTDAFDASTEERKNHIKATQPVANPEDIADVIAFLAGPKSRWVNGGTINTNNALCF